MKIYIPISIYSEIYRKNRIGARLYLIFRCKMECSSRGIVPDSSLPRTNRTAYAVMRSCREYCCSCFPSPATPDASDPEAHPLTSSIYTRCIPEVPTEKLQEFYTMEGRKLAIIFNHKKFKVMKTGRGLNLMKEK